MATLLALLPNDFVVPMVFLIHMARDSYFVLPDIFQRKTGLRVIPAKDDQLIEERTVYVAPPGKHVIIENGTISLRDCDQYPKTRFCPSLNLAITSAAEHYGKQLAVVILSGSLDDGVSALKDVNKNGGLTIVQHPYDAAFPSMPMEAIRRDHPNFIEPLDNIPNLLDHFSKQVNGVK